MKLTNSQIYTFAQEIHCLLEQTDLYIPVKANFYLQKNIHALMLAAEEIEKARIAIAAHYGTLDSETQQYIVPVDKVEIANQEILNLFAIEQDVNILTFKLEDLGQAEFTQKQMQIIMFMIEE